MAESVSPIESTGDRESDLEREQVRNLAEIFRGILVAALAAAITGTVVGGLGGRVVMRVAALLNPQAVGLGTENGNTIGDITLGGTFALLLFGGLLMGLAASVVWVAVSPWIPGDGVRRAVLAVPIAIALGGLFLVRSGNPDFVILDQDLVIVAMLLALVGAFGFCLALLEERLDRRAPHPGVDPRQFAASSGFLVLVGVILFVPLTIGLYFSDEACPCSVAPVPLAVPLLVAGSATLLAWAQRTRGQTEPSAPVRLAGRLGLLVAVGLGVALIASRVAAIPL